MTLPSPYFVSKPGGKTIRKLLALTALALAFPVAAEAHLVTKPANRTVQAINKSQTLNLAHANFVCNNGRKSWTKTKWHCYTVRWLERENYETRAKIAATLSPESAICLVFGSFCSEALRVSYCETGGTYSIYARNGQYLGLFQMGNYARSTYGHSYTAIGQARSAYAYFIQDYKENGYYWGPWECKP